MKLKQLFIICLIGVGGTFFIGTMASRLHDWFPMLFNLPSTYPYVDSFILVMSIITTFFMIQKKIECWIIWIIIDLVATYLYFVKGANFFAVEDFLFTILASFGLVTWIREYKSYQKAS